MKRIHIVGSGPRTGTTLLTEAMHACFEIDEFCEHEAPISSYEPRQNGIFLTKCPSDFAALRLPMKLKKDLYVVCLVRDPRDSIVSFHGSEPGVYWTSLCQWKWFISCFGNFVDNDRFIIVKYEDFVRDPDGTQSYLSERIPFLKLRHKFSNYHKVAKPSKKSLDALKEVRPIGPSGLGSWRNHLPRVKQQIRIHGSINDELIKFGYEKDCSWEKLLEDVEDFDYRTRKPEYIRRRDYIRHKGREIYAASCILLSDVGINPKIALAPVRGILESLLFIYRLTFRKLEKRI